MSAINRIIEDLEALNGANVKVFGQPTTLANGVDNYTIDAVDIFKALEEYELDSDDWTTYEEDEDGDEIEKPIFTGDETSDEIIDTLEELGYIRYENYEGFNTYNWSAPINHHLEYKIFKCEIMDGFFVEISANRYGDVRGNYTDSAILFFNSSDTYVFYQALEEASYKYNTVSVDGIDYNVTISLWHDGFEVYSDETGDKFSIYDYIETNAEMVDAIKAHLAE